ncbi:IclR family transcriptional regulator [Catenovulum agarivorans DS-2]|uniref:IclR family transcriptional regulator n=1 Tax=Catenovulum agarivorans DS-2 TaxID=1328313 RepID=W7QHW6_9ALTE|nr:IclR family transcriptional regulator [Catenovulum agarivorans]EWH08522.1 IclR family transcriptional regulator [Catenovulum agarivorans DS-2]
MKATEKKSTNEKTTKYAVPALDKGLDILEYLVSQELPRSQAEIAQGVGRNPNEIYRVLVGLEARGYLVRDELSGRYQLSLKLYNLSRSISPIDQLRQVALPHMEDLAVRIGQSCYLSMLYQSQTMVIIQARSQVPVSINIAEGSLFPTMTTTSGKVLLANSNDEVRDMILQRDKSFSKMSKNAKTQLFDELDSIKHQGYLHADNSITDGVCDIAVLIGQPGGKVVAALAVSLLNSKLTQDLTIEDIKQELLDTAAKIAEQLGY